MVCFYPVSPSLSSETERTGSRQEEADIVVPAGQRVLQAQGVGSIRIATHDQPAAVLAQQLVRFIHEAANRGEALRVGAPCARSVKQGVAVDFSRFNVELHGG